MCLILFAYQHHPRYRLVFVANRDEFYDRPTAPLTYWQDHPHILAGRDLKGMGTWMGITRNGRLAAITNYRDPLLVNPKAPSRGALVSGFLIHNDTPADYLRQVKQYGTQYNGFNLMVGDESGLSYYSNRGSGIQTLKPGIYGLSNHLLDTAWPKIQYGKSQLATLLANDEKIEIEVLFDLLQNQTLAPDDQLPNTGVGLEWERLLAPIFISSTNYGTRCSSALLIENSGRLTFIERTWQLGCKNPTTLNTRQFNLWIDP